MNPISSVEEARKLITAFGGSANEFFLPISDELQDQFGMNMAMITDAILSKGWEPDGFIQENGFRTYQYKGLGS